MIHIKIKDRFVPEADPMGRGWVGWEEGMSPEQVYERNRGIYYLGVRADRESLAVFSYKGTIVAVTTIDELETYGNKRAIVGKVLQPGDPTHDALMGKPAPDKDRNPMTYASDPDGPRTCACGCRAEVSGARVFAPGHDQRAIHERISRQWGDTLGFINWFDKTYS